jgi:hypothetical protein
MVSAAAASFLDNKSEVKQVRRTEGERDRKRERQIRHAAHLLGPNA